MLSLDQVSRVGMVKACRVVESTRRLMNFQRGNQRIT